MSVVALIVAFLSGAAFILILEIAGLRSLLAPFEDILLGVLGAG